MTSGAATDPAPLAPLAELWSLYLDFFACQNEAILRSADGLGDPRAARKRWLEVMTQTLDRFMRSPAVLQAMEKNLKNWTAFKAMHDELLANWARQFGLPAARDVNEVAGLLGRETAHLRAHLEAIEVRLQSIEKMIKASRGSSQEHDA